MHGNISISVLSADSISFLQPAQFICWSRKILCVLLLSFLSVLATSGQSFAQSCSLSVVDSVNSELSNSGASGLDVLEIDFDNGGAITCTAAGGNANTAFNDRAEISHCQTENSTDLCFVVDKYTAITAANITGPGLAAGGVSPADDNQIDLSAGTYTVLMTVTGVVVSFSFTIIELDPDDQRLASQAISINVGAASAVIIANTTDGSEPATNGQLTVSQDIVSTTDTVIAYSVTGTATPGTDYTTLSGTATIPSGTLSTVIDVAVLDDNDIEGDETVIVTLDSITSGTATLGATLTATNTISDEDSGINNQVAQAFASQTHNFVARRMTLLSGNSPTMYRTQFDGKCSDNGKHGFVSASGDGDQTMGFFALTSGSQNCVDQVDPFVWAEGQFAIFDDEQGLDSIASTTGDFFVGYAGVTIPINPDLNIGVMGQIDWFEDRMESGLGEASGTGWAIGTFLSTQFLDGMQFDARAMWGQSENNATQTVFGTNYSGDFNTDRWLIEAILSGKTSFKDFTIRPSARVFYMEEDWGLYSVTDGNRSVVVPEGHAAIGTLSSKFEVSYIQEYRKIAIEPYASAEMTWVFEDPGIYNAAGVLQVNNALSGTVAVGINLSNENSSIRLEATYGGLGSGGLESLGGTFSFSHKF